MNPVDKALWYIETHSSSDLSLDDIAGAVAVSKYYLLRAFSAATGVSIMRYVRCRRLSSAARRLAVGASDILAVAIESGYGSHEAFTRAFREQLGCTPETVRARGTVEGLPLQEALHSSGQSFVTLPLPRFVTSQLLLIAGVVRRYDGVEAGAGVPTQWQDFANQVARIPRRFGQTTYGVCYNTDDEGGMDYLCGVEVSNFTALPNEFTRLRLPAQRFVVFFHTDHLSSIRSTWHTIWNQWLPQSGHEAADAPLFERYDERFNSHSGAGGVELWVPLAH